MIFVTGMSGTGKSAALAELARRGHHVVDTDYGGFAEEVADTHGGWEHMWREDRIAALLEAHEEDTLFLAGCVANQGRFYPRFDAVVLLSAPLEVMLERIAARDANAFGKQPRERERVVADLQHVEPLLRESATTEIDTRASLGDVADQLERIAAMYSSRHA